MGHFGHWLKTPVKSRLVPGRLPCTSLLPRSFIARQSLKFLIIDTWCSARALRTIVPKPKWGVHRLWCMRP
jgi:hypothetical protein